MKTIFTLVWLLMLVAASGNARIKLSSLIADNMVLQQQGNVRLWGTAQAGEQISVTPTWNGKTVTAKADRQGRWMLTLATPQASFTPYEITVSNGNKADDILLKNVLVGEVWLASGQRVGGSNQSRFFGRRDTHIGR